MDKITDEEIKTISDRLKHGDYSMDFESIIHKLIANYQRTKDSQARIEELEMAIKLVRDHFEVSVSQCVGYHRKFALSACNSVLPPQTTERK
jgi:archaellum component FlaC